MIEYETRLQEKISHNNHYYLCNKNNYYNMYYYVLYYLSLLHARDGFVWAYYKNGDDTINYFFLLSSHKCIICNGIKSEIRIHFFYV